MVDAGVIAIDLGAGSARIGLARLRDRALDLRIVHRFAHQPRLGDGPDGRRRLRWEWPTLMAGIRDGIARADADAAAGGIEIRSLSCASWSQDFGLLDRQGRLLAAPVSYRDQRTDGMPFSASWPWPLDALLRRVGSCLSPVTTLCQLRALRRDAPAALEQAHRLLPIADLVHHGLGAEAATDLTMASASQLCSSTTGAWDHGLMREFGLPAEILPPIAERPRGIGELRLPRSGPVPILVTAGHDTAAATACIPRLAPGTWFLGLGTWSMLGCGTDAPLVAPDQATTGLATLRMPRSTWASVRPGVGMRLVHEYQGHLERAGHAMGSSMCHARLAGAAESALGEALIDVGGPGLDSGERILAAVGAACRARGHGGALGAGEIAKVLCDSLAADLARGYAQLTRAQLTAATGQRCERLHVLGGGVRNRYLMRRLAAEIPAPLTIGPAEATLFGNAVLQFEAHGLADRAAAIALVPMDAAT